MQPLNDIFWYIKKLNADLVDENLRTLAELREETGMPNLESEADAFAKNVNNHFKKRNNVHRKPEYFTEDNVIIIADKKSSNYQFLLGKIEEIYREQPINTLR